MAHLKTLRVGGFAIEVELNQFLVALNDGSDVKAALNLRVTKPRHSQNPL